MTATNLPLTTLSADGVTALPAGTAIDQSNGMAIAFTTSTIPANPNMDRLILLVETTNGADKTVTVKAGAIPPAFREQVGDLTVTVPAANGGGIIGPFGSSRFAQADGSITLAFQSGITGWITAILLPRSW